MRLFKTKYRIASKWFWSNPKNRYKKVYVIQRKYWHQKKYQDMSENGYDSRRVANAILKILNN